MTEILTYTSNNISNTQNINTAKKWVALQQIFCSKNYINITYSEYVIIVFLQWTNNYTINYQLLCCSYIFRHYFVFLRDLVVSTLLSYINISILKHSSTHTQTQYTPASITTASTQRLYIRSLYKSSYKF